MSSSAPPIEAQQTFFHKLMFNSFAAGAAIFPVFHLFRVKTAFQTKNPAPAFTLTESVFGGIKAVPVIGSIIGAQITTQEQLEKVLKISKATPFSTFFSELTSSAIIGGISVPGLLIFNGLAMGISPSESIKRACPKQALAICARETVFVASVTASNPITEAMKKKTGDNKLTQYAGPFFSGAIGSYLSHPADTILTWIQSNGQKKTFEKVNLKALMAGSKTKSIAVGIFAVLYNQATKAFD